MLREVLETLRRRISCYPRRLVSDKVTVKPLLPMRLEDVSRVEATIANLKEALAPHVITNGRNLWVHWRRIDKDALVVVVDVKLPYPGGSTAYYDAVGQCNVLIAKAIQDAGAELCLPTSRRVDIKK